VPSVDIPAGGNVSFAPMAYHVMLVNLKDRSLLSDGKRFPLTMHFEKSGAVTVDVSVQKKPPESMQTHAHAQ
jgi:copper(I)-binding protein